MKTIAFYTMCILFSLSIASAQKATIRGKITDIATGEPLIGAAVVLKSDLTVGTVADFDGNFSLSVPAGKEITVLVSYISYQSTEKNYTLDNKEVVVENFTLVPSTVELEDVVVVAKGNRSKDAYLESIKVNSSVSFDFISSETIKKIGDSDINSAVKRVTGVSTFAGFISVRGLSDRYIRTTINGGNVPTLDPFTNNIKLDIFPTALVDNIIINKTNSPELPGDWSGAYLSIETKDYPTELTVHISSSFGYTSGTTFKDIIASKSGKTDWLGYDDGYRDIKHYSRFDFPVYENNPGNYEQFQAIGLGDYMNSLGLTENNLLSSSNNAYYNLMMVELDLLPPALFYDQDAQQTAIELYNDQYYPLASMEINAEAQQFAQSMPYNWGTIEKQALPDFSQDIVIGNQVNFLGKPLGFIVGLRYNKKTAYDPAAIKNKVIEYADGSLQYIESTTQESSSEIHSWSSLATLSYKLSPNHSISGTFMPNFSGENDARISQGKFEGEASHVVDQKYEERKQLVYQGKTSHYFPFIKLRVNTLYSYADGESNTPDFKVIPYMTDLRYVGDSIIYYNTFSNTNTPDRFYRFLNEDIKNIKVDFSLSLFEAPGLSRKLKFGAAYQESNRDYIQYNYDVSIANLGPDEDEILNNDLNSFFTPDKFMFDERGRMPLFYTNDTTFINHARNNSIGKLEVYAGYLMIDYDITSRFRTTLGARVEDTYMFSDLNLLLGLPEDHGLRQKAGFGSHSVNKAEIDQTDILPMGSLIYKVFNNDKNTSNLRLNYSKSIGRPSIREITYSYVYDYTLRGHVLGEPGLKVAEIQNVDFRFESYFSSNENISVSLFFKNFKNHIAIAFSPNGYSWINEENAFNVYGMELEGKKNIVKGLELRSNITIVETRVITDSGLVVRDVYGQAPYVINALLSYDHQKSGFSTSLSYNVQGAKIAIYDNASEVYELPRHLFDFKISKELGEHFSVSFKIRDLLNKAEIRRYKYNDFELLFDKYNNGTNYVLSFSYNL